MREIPFKNILNKNLRLLKNRTESLINTVYNLTEEFPCENYPGCGYWHLQAPADEELIDAVNTPKSIKQDYIQAILDRAFFLYKNKIGGEYDHLRVIAGITLPNVWDSQLIVFFGDKYYSSFYNRNSDYQKWTPCSKSLKSKYKITIPQQFKERCYIQEIWDADYYYKNEIYFIGELS